MLDSPHFWSLGSRALSFPYGVRLGAQCCLAPRLLYTLPTSIQGPHPNMPTATAFFSWWPLASACLSQIPSSYCCLGDHPRELRCSAHPNPGCSLDSTHDPPTPTCPSGLIFPLFPTKSGRSQRATGVSRPRALPRWGCSYTYRSHLPHGYCLSPSPGGINPSFLCLYNT